MILLNKFKKKSINLVLERLLKKIIKEFPGQLVSAYVSGSYASNYAVSTSDLDLELVFSKPLKKGQEHRLRIIAKSLSKFGPTLDLAMYDVKQLKSFGLMDLDRSCVHIWGKPIHDEISNPSIEDYAYRTMHGTFSRMSLTRSQKPYCWPLDFPDSEDPFKGYAWRSLKIRGKKVLSIKEIGVISAMISKSLCAYVGKIYVPRKDQSPQYFKRVFKGETAEMYVQLMKFCRSHLEYRLPTTQNDKKRLQELLPGLLSMENLFLIEYQNFLIKNLKSKDSFRRQMSLFRLGEILYPNKRSHSALKKYVCSNSVERRLLKKSSAMLRSANAR